MSESAKQSTTELDELLKDTSTEQKKTQEATSETQTSKNKKKSSKKPVEKTAWSNVGAVEDSQDIRFQPGV